MTRCFSLRGLGLGLLLLLGGFGCRTGGRPGHELTRKGDEIVVCGRLFHSGTQVVLWTDPGGYDAYRVERRFVPFEESSWDETLKDDRHPETPNRYGLRRDKLGEEEIERYRGGGWDLPRLQEVVDQFVLHYDATGTSERCFEVLHDRRGLSVHFMLDLDGTIYQTLDLKERAWHATTSNSRSIGIEIAQAGAVPTNRLARLHEWYTNGVGRVRLKLPDGYRGWADPEAAEELEPARPELVVGEIQGSTLAQYDFTPQQYDALVRLTATLCQVFPRLRCDYPRDEGGRLVRRKLPDEALRDYQGVLGHYHVQMDKVDPGPAFQWDTWLEGTRRELRRRGSAGWFFRP